MFATGKGFASERHRSRCVAGLFGSSGNRRHPTVTAVMESGQVDKLDLWNIFTVPVAGQHRLQAHVWRPLSRLREAKAWQLASMGVETCARVVASGTISTLVGNCVCRKLERDLDFGATGVQA